jgi:hypothetical protein
MADVLFDWRGPYHWRTNLRGALARSMNWMFPKGRDCVAVGGEHEWYNIDGSKSGCYHCLQVRVGELWKETSKTD